MRAQRSRRPQTAPSTSSPSASRLPRWVRQGALAAGLAATLLTSTRGAPQANAAATSPGVSSGETLHTTANHPWLTADRGWELAGDLHSGEPVRLLDGATATVVGLHVLSGVGPMWDLSLDATHTYGVGASQAVVHNTGPCDPVALNTTERPVYLHRVSPYGNRALGMSQQLVIKDILDNQQLLGSLALHGEGVWAYQLGPNSYQKAAASK